MARSVSIRHSLLGSLLLVIVLLSGAMMATTFFESRQAVRALSKSLMSQAIDQIEAQLHRFFDPVRQELLVVQAWGYGGLLDVDNPSALNRLLGPLMQQHPQVSSLLVADERGRENMLLRLGNKWLNRQTKRDQWDNRTRWLEWSDQQPEPVESWRELDYDPRRRPWYQGALRKRAERESASAQSYAHEQVHWTAPYTFFTTKDPGITASVMFDTRDGLAHVIGFDIMLNDISQFTTNLRLREHGKVFVLTDDGRVIGLPRDQRYEDVGDRKQALLRLPHELGVAVVADAVQAFAAQLTDQQGPIRFRSRDQVWWGEVRPFQLAPDRTLSMAVVVPESDLLSDLSQMRLWILVITVGVLALAIWLAAILARRYSRPIEALVRESDRIRSGNLDRGEVVESTVTEVQRLAQAHERMRVALQSLFKLEGDLQLARQIQQSTLPDRLPVLSGCEISAWSEAAEETGGDTYDVVGYRRTLQGGSIGLSPDRADGAVLLLADATGHGVGPALSVTQVRAMLRMAVRMGAELPMIARQMNEQLCTDLHAGRFITVWLGDLNTADYTLTSFSGGQAPLLHYQAARNSVDVLAADTLPFGIADDLDIADVKLIALAPGDIFAVLSDGIFEAMDTVGRQFGIDRVVEMISTHRRASSGQILVRLQEALGEFTKGAPAADDRTAIIIKRTEPSP